MSAARPLLEVRSVAKSVPLDGGGRLDILSGVDLTIAEGESFGLAGMSGSGKSVLGRIVLNLMAPTAGEVVFDGTKVTGMSRRAMLPIRARMQMVFQNPLTAMNPRRTAGSSLELPLINHGLGNARQRALRVAELLDLVGLSPRHARYYPHEFSGGQCQRLGIARAIASNPRFIVLDEPVSALDVSIQAQTLNLLKELQQRLRLTYLFVANSLGVLHFACDRIAVLSQGRIAEVAATDRLFTAPQSEATRQLLAAMVPFRRRPRPRPNDQP
jgi:ABC-type glutathione transport system ATPase component